VGFDIRLHVKTLKVATYRKLYTVDMLGVIDVRVAGLFLTRKLILWVADDVVRSLKIERRGARS
jgi:hypothetical protein